MNTTNFTTQTPSVNSTDIKSLQARVREILVTLPPYEQLNAMQALQAAGAAAADIPGMMENILRSWLSCYEDR